MLSRLSRRSRPSRRRRSRSSSGGGASPASGVDLVGWEHAYYAAGSAFVAEGYTDTDTVTTWPDEVGSQDLTVGTSKPTYDADDAGLNNQPCVSFSGTQIIKAAASAAITQPFSLVLIGRVTTNVANDFLIDGLATGSRAAFIDRGASGWDLFAGNTVRYDPGTTDTAAHRFVGIVNGATSSILVDGVETAGDAGANNYAGLTLGGAFDDVSFKIAAKFAFVGVYDGDVQDDPGWSAFDAWVTETYGISLGGGGA